MQQKWNQFFDSHGRFYMLPHEDFSRFLNESPAFKHVLASPVFSHEEKQGVLAELNKKVGSPPIMTEFFEQLLKKNRLGFLPEIAEAFGEIIDQRKHLQHVWVSSARDISAKEQKEIQKAVTIPVSTAPGGQLQRSPR